MLYQLKIRYMQWLKDFTGLVSKKFIKIISTVGCFGSKFHMARINYQKHSLCTWLILHNITRRLKIVLAVFENCFGKFLWWCFFFSCGIKNVQKNVCHYKNQHSSQYVLHPLQIIDNGAPYFINSQLKFGFNPKII